MEKLAELAIKIKSYTDKFKGTGLFNNTNEEEFTSEELLNCYKILVYILGHEKPTGDLGPARDDTEEEDVYYKEREWRIIPSNAAVNSLPESIEKVSEDGEDRYKIKFNREDIRVIVVPSVNIKKEIVSFLRSLSSFEDDLPAILIYDELKYF